jgi:hypothetical protein
MTGNGYMDQGITVTQKQWVAKAAGVRGQIETAASNLVFDDQNLLSADDMGEQVDHRREVSSDQKDNLRVTSSNQAHTFR